VDRTKDYCQCVMVDWNRETSSVLNGLAHGTASVVVGLARETASAVEW